MSGRPPRESGRADVAALAAAVLLALSASLPDLLLRTSADWKSCFRAGNPAARPPAAGPERSPEEVRFGAAIARAEDFRGTVATSVFRPDPTRVAGPLPAPRAPGTVRVEDLDGKVVDGRLSLRWTPVPGSRATLIRVEGTGAPEAVEREVPSDTPSLLVPVPGAAGRISVRATPVGAAGAATEARLTIPFRIPVEVVRAGRASPETQSALLVLRRPYDGSPVEGEFALHGADAVGGLSPAGPGGPPVEFLTDYVLDEVRARTPTVAVIVPEFGPDGRVVRDTDGVPLLHPRTVEAGVVDVVLRGLNDERKVLEAR